MKYEIPDSDRELLRECRVDVFRGTGPGGQSVNTTNSAVRLTHLPSGIVVNARNERSQLLNKRAACEQLRRKLAHANYTPPKRVPTRPSGAAKQRRLASKRMQAIKKRQRRRPTGEE